VRVRDASIRGIELLAADSPFSDTWKFNPAKGHPLPPLPKTIVAQVEADEQNFKFSEEFVDDEDQTSKLSYDAKIDGKDCPVTGDPDTDSASLRRVNERKIEFATKKAGKVTSKFDAPVSKDGKTATVSGTDTSQGRPQKFNMVYDKQKSAPVAPVRWGCGSHRQRSYCDHDTQKRRFAGTDRDDSDDGSLAVDVRPHLP
jgi:hypothetical protein